MELSDVQRGVVVRLNDVHHAGKQFDHLWGELERRWRLVNEEGVSASTGKHLDHTLRGMRGAYKGIEGELLRAVAAMLVYGCLAAPLLDQLYRPTVAAAPFAVCARAQAHNSLESPISKQDAPCPFPSLVYHSRWSRTRMDAGRCGGAAAAGGGRPPRVPRTRALGAGDAGAPGGGAPATCSLQTSRTRQWDSPPC